MGKIQHISGVKIGDNVEIGSHTTVNRGCLSNTVIENGVKLTIMFILPITV